MDAFELCVSCARHIKRAECACPFCGAPHTSGAPTPRRGARVSRAAWLATTLALVGCSSASSSGSSLQKGPAKEAGAAADADVSEAASEQDAADQAEASTEQDALPEAASEDAGEDAGYDAGWHTCYGAPPMRAERATTATGA
jgi:hypothetical protein